MVCCDSTSREEPISRASPKLTSTRSPCGSINARERPWASKRQPINYERCCTDRLNRPAYFLRYLTVNSVRSVPVFEYGLSPDTCNPPTSKPLILPFFPKRKFI